MKRRETKQANIPITHCVYCGSYDLGIGWQQNEAIVTFRRNGFLGNRLKYVICRDCGAKLRIPAATDRDLDDLCCHMKLVIPGKRN